MWVQVTEIPKKIYAVADKLAAGKLARELTAAGKLVAIGCTIETNTNTPIQKSFKLPYPIKSLKLKFKKVKKRKKVQVCPLVWLVAPDLALVTPAANQNLQYTRTNSIISTCLPHACDLDYILLVIGYNCQTHRPWSF